MAVYGVLADIHGNREALVAALAALERRGVRQLVCLGDVVGFNADPDECVALVRERCTRVIAGNHDLIGVGRLDFARCSNKARYSLKRTRRCLAPESIAWLAALPPHLVLDEGIVLVHGGVRDVEQYMITPAHIRRNAGYLRADFPGARICLFGHSHEQKLYEVDGESVRDLALGEGSALSRERIYFVNPGSVDAARKRTHKRAEFALLDTVAWSIEYCSVPYDCAAAEAKAAALGYRIPPWVSRWYTLRARLAGPRWPRRKRHPRPMQPEAD